MNDPDSKVEALTDADFAALAREIELGQRLFDFYYDREWDRSIRDIDRLLSDWKQDPRESIPPPNDIALGLGSLVGEYLRNQHSLSWVVVTDQFGCSLGMIDDDAEWQVFPRDWIAKRLSPEIDEPDVVTSLISTLIDSGALSPKRASEQGSDGKPDTAVS